MCKFYFKKADQTEKKKKNSEEPRNIKLPHDPATQEK